MKEITILGTFLEGLLSFLSPCVLPLVPLYVAYLSGEYKEVDEDGKIKYNQLAVFLRTVFFVLGIVLVFCLLAISIDSVKEYIADYKDIIAIAGSVIILFFGLHELGIIEISFLNKEASLKDKLHLENMTYFKAFAFGVFFAFAWTPCIGPMLSSALLMTISNDGGVIYLFAYCLGLTLPFIITGLATSFVLNFLNRFKKVLNIIIKISGVILIGFAIYMFVNASNNIVNIKRSYETQEARKETGYSYLPQTEYRDHLGNTIKFEDYEGKYIILNYIATWCSYCKQEIPDYLEFAKENPDVVCLYVMSNDANGVPESEIAKFAEDYGVSVPIIIDENNELYYLLKISSFPTVWICGPDQSTVGYANGMLDKDTFKEVLAAGIKLYQER